MVLVIGLGNPGSEYAGTRHNVGFAVVEELAARFRTRLSGEGVARSGRAAAAGIEFILAQPLTYMNNSGEAAGALLIEHGLSPGDMIVCCDDLHLPLGSVRIRKRGGDGGHNGLRSVIGGVGTREFPRIRCGIRGDSAPAPGEASAEYVLAGFEPGELGPARLMVSAAADAVLAVLGGGIDRAMNVVNVKHSVKP